MKRALWLLALAACGRAQDSANVRADVSLAQGLTAADLQSLDLTVAEGSSTDGTPFTCAKLGSDWILERTDVEIHYHQLLTPGATKVASIAKGSGLVVVLDGYTQANGLGTRAASGCVDGVTITAGQTKSIAITLSALQ